jgi:hypothetical protein
VGAEQGATLAQESVATAAFFGLQGLLVVAFVQIHLWSEGVTGFEDSVFALLRFLDTL